MPDGVIIADYHLDDEETGWKPSPPCAGSCGPETPAILLTADRSLAVRERPRAEKNVHVLNKPLKPAALRALIAQWRVLRVAAAE